MRTKLKNWCLNVGIGAIASLTLVLLLSTLYGLRPGERAGGGRGALDLDQSERRERVEPNITTVVASGSQAAPRIVRVEVLNGCGVRGAASAASSVLRATPGIDVVTIGNARGIRIGRSVVLDRTRDGQAGRVAGVLGIDDVLFQRTSPGRPDVTVIVGYDQGRWDEPLAGH